MIYLLFHICIDLPTILSLCRSTYHSITLQTYLPFHLCTLQIYLLFHICIDLPTILSLCRSTYHSITLQTYLPFHLCTLQIYLPFHLSSDLSTAPPYCLTSFYHSACLSTICSVAIPWHLLVVTWLSVSGFKWHLFCLFSSFSQRW